MAKALIVDDSRAVRMILSKTLRELGFEVREAANGREALEVIETEKTAVTLVLADWNMPEINGLELLKRLRRNPELSSLVVVIFQKLVHHAQPRSQLGPRHRLLALIPRRRRVLEHIPYHLSRQAELPRRLPLAYPVHLHRPAEPRIYFQPVHLPGVANHPVLGLQADSPALRWSTFRPAQSAAHAAFRDP